MGRLNPTIDSARIPLSTTVPFFCAATTATGIEISADSTVITSTSSRVMKKRLATIPNTGAPSTYEVPKSPRTIPASQVRYCTISGRSRPSCARRAASASGVCSMPSRTAATSPGTSLNMKNTALLTRNRISSICSTRRRMKWNIAQRMPAGVPPVPPAAVRCTSRSALPYMIASRSPELSRSRSRAARNARNCS